MSATLETTVAVAEPAGEACGVCKLSDDSIWLHSSQCGKAICKECVMDSELGTGLCSLCNPPKTSNRRERGRRGRR